MNKFNSESHMKNYMTSEFDSESQIVIVTSLDTIEEILDNSCMEYKSLTKEIKEDSYIYILEKYTSINNEIHIDIEALQFSDDGDLETEIYSNVVIIEEGLLDDDDFEMIYADEITVVDYEDEEEFDEFDDDFNLNSDLEDNGCQCETCQEARELAKEEDDSEDEDYEKKCLHDCKFCNCCEDDEEEFEEEDTIALKLEFIEGILEDYGEFNLITDYETTKAIVSEYSLFDYEDYFSITLNCETEGYLVNIEEGSLFVVEPIERDGEYFDIECDDLFIDEDIEDYLDEEFVLHLNCELIGMGLADVEE